MEQGQDLLLPWAQDSHWGNYFIANKTEQANEELVYINRSLTHLSLLPRLSPAPDFSTSSSPLLTFVPTWLSVTDSYSFVLAAAVQQFFLLLKCSSLRAAPAVADGLSRGSENENTLFPNTPLVC